jgi:hypothetical protein
LGGCARARRDAFCAQARAHSRRCRRTGCLVHVVLVAVAQHVHERRDATREPDGLLRARMCKQMPHG